MRFFVGACLLCLLIASVGCMTDNWSRPLLRDHNPGAEENVPVNKPGFFHQTFGQSSGVDARAREIEKSLGFDR